MKPHNRGLLYLGGSEWEMLIIVFQQLSALVKTLHLQTAPADLFSSEQGMTGYTGQLSSGSWSAIFPRAIAMNEIAKKYQSVLQRDLFLTA